MALHCARQRRMKAAGVDYLYRVMERTGKSAVEVQSLKSDLGNEEVSDEEEEEEEEQERVQVDKGDVSFDDLMSEEDESVDDSSQDSDYNANEDDEEEDDEEEEVKGKHKSEKKSRFFYCMDERLFEQYCTFTSEVCVKLFSVPFSIILNIVSFFQTNHLGHPQIYQF